MFADFPADIPRYLKGIAALYADDIALIRTHKTISKVFDTLQVHRVALQMC